MLAVAACQQSKETPAEANPDAKPGLSISGGTLVLPAVKGNPGAAYFTLTNSGDAPTSLANVYIDGAGKTEMHETKDGVMSPLNWVQLDPGATVKFERGGKHVMAFELADTLKPGDSAEMTLTFSGGDKLSAPLAVEAAGGGSSMTNMGDMEHGEHMEGTH
ncbi:MAG: copper chaperone PCu(A)C [Novosphingobium sp.]